MGIFTYYIWRRYMVINFIQKPIDEIERKERCNFNEKKRAGNSTQFQPPFCPCSSLFLPMLAVWWNIEQYNRNTKQAGVNSISKEEQVDCSALLALKKKKSFISKKFHCVRLNLQLKLTCVVNYLNITVFLSYLYRFNCVLYY